MRLWNDPARGEPGSAPRGVVGWLTTRHPVDVAIAVAALVAAYLLKSFYSTATAEELVWVLAPTVFLVELATGASFVFEAGEGYLSRELNLLVAPSCAGINFLIATVVTGALGLPHRLYWAGSKLLVVPSVVVAAYLLTVLTNALRLLTGQWIATLPVAHLDPEVLHRVEGVVVYFTTLCAAYVLACRLLTPPAAGRA